MSSDMRKGMFDKPASRRRFLRHAATAAGLVAVPLARPALAQTKLRDVAFRLDWIYQGPNAGFMVAMDKGFYTQAGLNVDMGPGKGSGSTAQLVASKAAQIGFSDGFVVGNSVSKGMSIRTVAAIYRRNPTGVIVREDSDIKTPKDLEGKSIAITAGSAQFLQWPAFAKGCGLDAGKIRVINIDPAGTPPALITGQVPAIAGFVQGQAPTVEIRGNVKTRVFWFADCGVNAVSNGIIVHNDLIKENPELIRDFVAASLKGFLYARQHPDEMVAIVKKFLPTAEPAIVRREAELSWQAWVTPNTGGKALGWSSDKDWTETVGVLKQYGGVTAPLEAEQLYTNDFVPAGAEFVPPQPEPNKT
jgi:NitT/TauT family transport system substrate-binding protein